MEADRGDLSKLLTSTGLVLAGGVLSSLVKLAERIAIARTLSVDAYGTVSIGLAVMSLGATVGLAGFRQGVPRYVSRFESPADRRGAWATGLLVTAVVSVAVVVALLLAGDAVAEALFGTPAAGSLLALFVLTIPFNVGMTVGIGAIRGLGNTVYRTLGRDLFYYGTRVLLLVALLWLGLGVLAAGYAYLLATVAAFLVVHYLLSRLIPLTGEVNLHAREMTRFSAPLLVSSVVGLMLARTDTLMLGYFRTPAEVGLYNAAYPLASGMLVVLSSFGFMYLPVASRLDAADEREEVNRVYTVTTKWIYLMTFPLFLTFLAFPRDVLAAVFGPAYTPAAPALQLLAVGFFTNAAAGRNRETLSALGVTGYVLATNSLALVANVVLNLLLVPPYGFLGAAVASAASFVTFNVAVGVILRGRFDISPFSRWSTRTFVLLPALLLPPAALASTWLSLDLLTLPPFVVVVAAVTVYTAAVTGCLQPADRVAVELFEAYTGLRPPLIDWFIPRAHADGERPEAD